MGVIIPFTREQPTEGAAAPAGNQELRLQLLESSIDNYRRQIEQIESAIRTKCAHELDLLDKLHAKVSTMETEIQRLKTQSQARRQESLS